MDLVCVSVHECERSLGIETTCPTPISSTSVGLRCGSDSYPLQPRWSGCDAFKIEISKVTTPDSAASASAERFPPSLPFSVTQEQLRFSTQTRCHWENEIRPRRTKKSAARMRGLPKRLVCCALRKPGTENIWQADREARAIILSSCCRTTCSCSTRFNILLESVKRSADCFIVSCPQRPSVQTDWVSSFFC